MLQIFQPKCFEFNVSPQSAMICLHDAVVRSAKGIKWFLVRKVVTRVVSGVKERETANFNVSKTVNLSCLGITFALW